MAVNETVFDSQIVGRPGCPDSRIVAPVAAAMCEKNRQRLIVTLVNSAAIEMEYHFQIDCRIVKQESSIVAPSAAAESVMPAATLPGLKRSQDFSAGNLHP